MIRQGAAALGLLLCGSATLAGSFVPVAGEPVDSVLHPAPYTGVGGEYVLSVCLDPAHPPVTGNPLPALRSALARLNSDDAALGNAQPNTPTGPDFESLLLHELGHCIGLGHSAIGPSEVAQHGGQSTQLYYTNALPGPDGLLTTLAGDDGVRGSADDFRGDDINLHWFRIGRNAPFANLPAVVDRSTYSVDLAQLPDGQRFAEIASGFDPCTPAVEANTSALRNVARTQSVMFPALCSAHRIRQLAPDDLATLRIARAGLDGIQGTADDYRVVLRFRGHTADCDLPIRFEPAVGFGTCSLDVDPLPGANLRIRDPVIRFERAIVWQYTLFDNAGTDAHTDLALRWLPAQRVIEAGEQANVALELHAQNGNLAEGIEIQLDLPPPLQLLEVSGGCSAFPCSLPALLGGDRLSLLLRIGLDGDAPPAILQASASASSTTPDVNAGNNSATLQVEVLAPDPNRLFRNGFE